MNLSNFYQNRLTDAIYRGGALTSAGAAGSTAVVNKGIRAAATTYVVGDLVVPNAVDTGAGGKFLQCTIGGASQGVLAALAIGNPGTTVVDNACTWTVVSGMPSLLTLYVALFTINKGLRANSTAYSLNDCFSVPPQGGVNGNTKQHVYYCTTAGTTAAVQPQYNGADGEAITDGGAVFTEIGPIMDSNTGFPAGLAEVIGGAYARVKLSAAGLLQLADMAGTQGALSTTSSTGTSGTTSNNAAITWAAPTANWGQVGLIGLYDQLVGGNLVNWGALTLPKTINNGDPAPSFTASTLTIQVDN